MIVEALLIGILSFLCIDTKDIGKSLLITIGGGIVFGIVLVILFWLITPAFVGIFWGYFAIAAIPIIIGSLIVFFWLNADETDWLQIAKIAVVLLIGAGLLFTNAFRANDLYDIPEVTTYKNISAGGVLPDIDQDHIRLVTREAALQSAANILGEKKLGSKYEIKKEDLHIQNVNDELVWIAPLRYRDAVVWWKNGNTPGYASVSAEKPDEKARLVTEFPMKYTLGAYWTDDLQRHLYLKGYQHIRLEDFTLEVTDEGYPRYVISLTKPTVWNSGYVVDRILVVNPVNGDLKEYAPDNAPEWIDRIMPERIATNYLDWYGRYKNGWWDQFLAKESVNEPTSTNIGGSSSTELWFVKGRDQQYWFTGMTSISSSDDSLSSIMLVGLRNQKIYEYDISGPNEQSIVSAVQSAVSNYDNRIAGPPIPHNYGGKLTYTVPVDAVDNQGKRILMEIAIVDASSSMPHVVIAKTKAEAFNQYRQYMSGKGFEFTFSSSSSYQEIIGSVNRFSDISVNGNSVYRIWLNNSEIIFEIVPYINPEVTITQVGDLVKISFDDNTETVVIAHNFDNLDLNARKGQDQIEFETDKEIRDEKKETLSEIENLERQKEELRNKLD